MSTSPINVLVVEDERVSRVGLRNMLRADPELRVGECGDGQTAVDVITQSAVDIVFLDIQMRGMSGFDVLEAVGVDRMPVVVFTTAYDAYAVRAFEACALDYLLKPISDERLARALARAKEAVRQRRLGLLSQQLAALLAHGTGGALAQAPAPQGDRVLVRTGNRSYFVDLADADWVEAEDNYSRLWIAGHGHLVRISLNRLAERLSARGFVRTHRTALVRADRVRELRAVGLRRYVLVLSDGTRVPVSRERRGALLQILRDAAPADRQDHP